MLGVLEQHQESEEQVGKGEDGGGRRQEDLRDGGGRWQEDLRGGVGCPGWGGAAVPAGEEQTVVFCSSWVLSTEVLGHCSLFSVASSVSRSHSRALSPTPAWLSLTSCWSPSPVSYVECLSAQLRICNLPKAHHSFLPPGIVCW